MTTSDQRCQEHDRCDEETSEQHLQRQPRFRLNVGPRYGRSGVEPQPACDVPPPENLQIHGVPTPQPHGPADPAEDPHQSTPKRLPLSRFMSSTRRSTSANRSSIPARSLQVSSMPRPCPRTVVLAVYPPLNPSGTGIGLSVSAASSRSTGRCRCARRSPARRSRTRPDNECGVIGTSGMGSAPHGRSVGTPEPQRWPRPRFWSSGTNVETRPSPLRTCLWHRR